MITWIEQAGDKYHVTGRDRKGKRFKTIITDNWYYAKAINVYNGSVWLVRDGKRRLLKRVYN